MDPGRFKEAFNRLEALDDRLTYRVRSRSIKARGANSPEQLDERVRDVAEYLLELREIVRDMMVAIAAKAPAAPGRPGSDE